MTGKRESGYQGMREWELRCEERNEGGEEEVGNRGSLYGLVISRD